jgi:hypothetical protein
MVLVAEYSNIDLMRHIGDIIIAKHHGRIIETSSPYCTKNTLYVLQLLKHGHRTRLYKKSHSDIQNNSIRLE